MDIVSNIEQTTLMRDVYQFHIGKWVRVFTSHPTPIVGTLHNFNGTILQVLEEITGIYTYISVMQVRAISGDDKP